jgi:phosphatidylserine/phosphatidylglycerophosphate/cardiolipin synthase-like enzyme
MIPLAVAGLLIGCGTEETRSKNRRNDDDASTTAGTGAGGGAGGSGMGASSGSGGSGASGGGATPSYAIDESVASWHAPDLRASLHYSPSFDLEDEVLPRLGAAQTSIRLAFFNIRIDSVKNLLAQKVQANVDVQVVLDKKQQDLAYNTMYEELVALGVPVTLVDNTSATAATMHDKFAVVDGKLVMTGSANYSTTAFHVSDEDLLTIEDTTLAARYETEFDELVAHGSAASTPYPPGAAVQAFMGPEDALDDRVIAALDGALGTAVIAMFEMNHGGIVGAILDAHARGVDVVVVMDEVQAGDPGDTADEQLAQGGVPVVLAHNTGNMVAEMHSKFLVVDHHLLLMGSYNYTNLASYYNDENLVVIEDEKLAARAEGKIAELVDAYGSASPASMGLVEGAQAVTFEVTNVTLDPGLELTIQSEGGGPFPSPVALTNGQLGTSIAAGTPVVYRYAVRHVDTMLVEESGTHAFTVPYAPGPFEVVDAFTP